MSEVTRILATMEQDDAHATDELLPVVYSRAWLFNEINGPKF